MPKSFSQARYETSVKTARSFQALAVGSEMDPLPSERENRYLIRHATETTSSTASRQSRKLTSETNLESRAKYSGNAIACSASRGPKLRSKNATGSHQGDLKIEL